jgi:hypothetical protein
MISKTHLENIKKEIKAYNGDSRAKCLVVAMIIMANVKVQPASSIPESVSEWTDTYSKMVKTEYDKLTTAVYLNKALVIEMCRQLYSIRSLFAYKHTGLIFDDETIVNGITSTKEEADRLNAIQSDSIGFLLDALVSKYSNVSDTIVYIMAGNGPDAFIKSPDEIRVAVSELGLRKEDSTFVYHHAMQLRLVKYSITQFILEGDYTGYLLQGRYSNPLSTELFMTAFNETTLKKEELISAFEILERTKVEFRSKSLKTPTELRLLKVNRYGATS